MSRSVQGYRKCHWEGMSHRSRETCYCRSCHESSKFHESFKYHERLMLMFWAVQKPWAIASARLEFWIMPLDLRSKQRRNRSKIQALRVARFKMVADSGYIGKNSALRMFPGALSSGQGINMAAGPQFGFWAVVHRCLQNMWARRHLGLFLFLLWMLVILCYFVNTSECWF